MSVVKRRLQCWALMLMCSLLAAVNGADISTDSCWTKVNTVTAYTQIECQDKALTGWIPANDLVNPSVKTDLTSIKVEKNSLSGTIPTQIGLLTNLKVFTSYRNDISGTLPTELALLQKMTELNVYKSKMSGTIPAGLTNPWQNFVIMNNKFHGCIPEELTVCSDELPNNSVNGYCSMSTQGSPGISPGCDYTIGPSYQECVDDGQTVVNSNGDTVPTNTCVAGPTAAPTPAPTPAAGVNGDPHFTGADADKWDFKGTDNTFYNLISAAHVTLNALFQHKTYYDAGFTHRKVEGSYMTAGFAAIKTAAGRLLHIGFDATRAVFVNVAVVNGTEPTAYKAPFSMTLDDISVALADRVVTITTPEWIVTLISKFKAGIVAAGNTCADGKCFLEVKVSPRVDVATLKVAPHGLIGQTYDGDGVGVIGKMDDYKTRDGVFTTSAMGEGAIEGDASDYEMASKYATDFKFSRWGKIEAKPRDVSQLTGQKVKSTGTKGAEATATEID